MRQKLYKIAESFQKKLAESAGDIAYDKQESKRRQSNYADIDWLKKLAGQLWSKRNELQQATSNPQDAFRTLRHLQSLVSVANHLVQTAKTTGMDAASAKKYKDALSIAIHGLASIPGLASWNEWFQSFANSLEQYQPRVFQPRQSSSVTIPMTINMSDSGSGSGSGYKAKEEELPLPPGLLEQEKTKIVPFPLGAVVNPNDPKGLSAFDPQDL